MPHEIDTTTGQAAVFTAGAPRWCGLGRNIQLKRSSAPKPIELAGLDWMVDQCPVSARRDDTRRKC
jgi:hypothetical protein